MPQIPLYEPQLRTRALPQVRQATPDVRVSTRGLDQVVDVLDRRIDRDARDEATRMELQIRKDWQQERARLRDLYKGDQADQYRQAADDWWKKAPQTYSQNFSPMAREYAANGLMGLQLQADGDTLGYVEGEKRRARESNFRALQTERIAEAGRQITPQNARQLGKMTASQLRQAAIEYAAGEGLGSEVGESLAREQIARFHADVAVALASKPGGAKQAQEYLREYGGDISLDVRTRLDEAITKTANNEAGQDFARSVATLPYAERLKKAGAIADPEVKKSALAQIDADEVRIQRVRTEQANQVYGTLRLGVLQGTEPSELQMATLAAVDPNKAADLQAVILAQRKAAKEAAKGTPVKTDWAVYESVSAAIQRGDPIEVYRFADRIGSSEMEKLIDLKNRRDDPTKRIEVATTEQQLNSFLASQTFSDREKGMFRDAVYDRLNEFAKRNKREASYDERKAIINALNTEVVTSKGVFWDSKDPAYKASPELRDRATEDALSPQGGAPGAQRDQFVVGRTYTDSAGNRAIYQGGGRWQRLVQQPSAAPVGQSRPAAAPAVAPAPVAAPAPAPAGALTPGVQLPPMRPAPAAAPLAAPTPAPVAAPVAAPVPAPAAPASAAVTTQGANNGQGQEGRQVTAAPRPAPAPVAAPTPVAAATPASVRPAPTPMAARAPAPAPAPVAPAPAPVAPAPAPVAAETAPVTVTIAGADELRATIQPSLAGADKATLDTLQSQISTVRRNIEGMRRLEAVQRQDGNERAARITRTEILKAEALVIQARDKLREERRAPLEFELEAARNLINVAQRDLDTARDETAREVFREVLAERRAEAQRLERELQAVLRF